MATGTTANTNTKAKSCQVASSDVRSCLKFSELWKAHPLNWATPQNAPFRKNGAPYNPFYGGPEPLYENQCAIKMSISLIDAGLSLDTYPKNRSQVHEAYKTNKKYRGALAAEELATWLSKAIGKPVIYGGPDARKNLNSKTGIVFFKDYWARTQTERNTNSFSGDHIDLWNGSALSGASEAPFEKAKSVSFWEIK